MGQKRGAQAMADGVYDFESIERDGGPAAGLARQRRIGFRSEKQFDDDLPSVTLPCHGQDPKPILEHMGFTLLILSENRRLFRVKELPTGWSKRLVPDAKTLVVSEIVDANGNVRAITRYQTHKSHRIVMEIMTRFYIVVRRRGHVTVAYIKDRKLGKKIAERIVDPHRGANRDKSSMALTRLAGKKASQWLDEQFADWKNPLAYWTTE